MFPFARVSYWGSPASRLSIYPSVQTCKVSPFRASQQDLFPYWNRILFQGRWFDSHMKAAHKVFCLLSLHCARGKFVLFPSRCSLSTRHLDGLGWSLSSGQHSGSEFPRRLVPQTLGRVSHLSTWTLAINGPNISSNPKKGSRKHAAAKSA